nr:DUF4166 domain-containing protein [Pseudoclavibacter chungangensis]
MHPRLRTYFATIPAGHIGVGHGVFERAGVPQRWLRPLVRLVEPLGVAFGGFEHEVPFRIVNRTVDGRALAQRDFHLRGRVWTMGDTVSLAPTGRLVDSLGRFGTVVAAFDVDVRGGALRLDSRAVGVRAGLFRLRLPSFVAPRISLTERFDDPDDRDGSDGDTADGQQHVDLTVTLPLLGTIYEYAGSFTYRIERTEQHT